LDKLTSKPAGSCQVSTRAYQLKC